MSLFEYPVPGTPTSATQAQRHRTPFCATSDGRVYRPAIPVRLAPVSSQSGNRPNNWSFALLDTGSDACLFTEVIARQLGIRPSGVRHRFQTASGPLEGWFAEVQLHLGLPSDRDEADWTAVVGFVPERVFPAGTTGIFGHGGGLDRLRRVELVLTPDGPEMPVVRLSTRDG